MINYLQSKNLLDEGFPKIKDNSMCNVMLNAMLAVSLAEINETMAKDDKINVKCLVDLLTKDHFEEEVYKKMVYEQAKHLPAVEKDLMMKKLEKNLTEFIVNRTADCLDGKKFLRMILEEKDSSEVFTGNENFCAKKYAIFKNLLDANDYKIDVNQLNVDSKRIDCNAEIYKLRQDIDHTFTKDLSTIQRECLVDKVKDAPIFDNLIWIKVLKDINAVDIVKEKEQKRFDDFFPSFFKNFSLCQIE